MHILRGVAPQPHTEEKDRAESVRSEVDLGAALEGGGTFCRKRALSSHSGCDLHFSGLDFSGAARLLKSTETRCIRETRTILVERAFPKVSCSAFMMRNSTLFRFRENERLKKKTHPCVRTQRLFYGTVRGAGGKLAGKTRPFFGSVGIATGFSYKAKGRAIQVDSKPDLCAGTIIWLGWSSNYDTSQYIGAQQRLRHRCCGWREARGSLFKFLPGEDVAKSSPPSGRGKEEPRLPAKFARSQPW